MSVEIEESGPVERKLRIEVPIAEVDAAFDRVYRRLQQQSRVRGFRPGKTPRSVLEKYFGEQAQGDVLESVIRESLGRALEESALPVIAEPQLSPDGVPKQGAPFIYQATVEIRPQIELRKVRGLSVARPALAEPDQDPVEAHLEELRQSHAALADEEPGTEVARGHVAIVHYHGKIDGETFQGGEGRDAELEIGSDRSLPGFEDALIGLRVGESREFDLDVPAEDQREQLAGKRVHFRVELAGLKRRVLAELDDEFAKDVSDFDTLEALRADLNRRIQEGRDNERKRLLQEALVDVLIQENPFPVPPSLVQRQLSSRVSRAVQQLRGRIPDETLRKMIEGWSEEWKPAAERAVRLAFLVNEIAAAENLSISDEEYDAQLREVSEESGRPIAAIQRQYRESGADEAVRQRLLEERVLELLLTEASLSDA